MKNILLVIDIVNFCCSERCETKKCGITFSKIRKMVPKLVKFIEKYRQKNGKVIYIKCYPWDKKHLAKNIIELYKDPKCRYYSSDKTGFDEKFYLVEPKKDDFIFSKNTYDAFSNAKLVNFLRKSKVKTLIITGIFGDGCVNATIHNGFSKGYNFIILKDLIETTDLSRRQKIQKYLKQYTWPLMFGKTITSDEFLRGMKK